MFIKIKLSFHIFVFYIQTPKYDIFKYKLIDQRGKMIVGQHESGHKENRQYILRRQTLCLEMRSYSLLCAIQISFPLKMGHIHFPY